MTASVLDMVVTRHSLGVVDHMEGEFVAPRSVFSAAILPSHRLLLVALYSLARDGVASVSVGTLAQMVGIGPRRVQQLTRDLEALGAVRVERQQFNSGVGLMVNRYYLPTEVPA